MTPAKIKKIREKLNLTQDELATILGVTKMTVWRYEDGRATPSDEATVKLANLAASLENPAERKHLKDLRKTPGGVAAITAVAAMGAAMFSGAAAAGAAAAGCAGIVASPAGKSLLSFLSALIGGAAGCAGCAGAVAGLPVATDKPLTPADRTKGSPDTTQQDKTANTSRTKSDDGE